MIVHEQDAASFGVVVDRIIDIGEADVTVHRRGIGQRGVVGSTVIQGHVVDVLDIRALVGTLA